MADDALDFALGPYYQVVIAGDLHARDSQDMLKAIREACRTPVQRNTFYEPIKVLADGHQADGNANENSARSKVLEDNLATA